MPTFVADELVTALKLNNATARDWTTWAPTYANLTIGNGTVVARYIQVGKLIVCYWAFQLGSSSAVGTNPEVLVPVAASSSILFPRNTVGALGIEDVGTAQFQGQVQLTSTTVFGLFVTGVGGTYATKTAITASVPMTWVTTDFMWFSALYEAA